MNAFKKFAVWVWKVFLGTVLCQFPVTAVLAIGWTYRAMQRQALRVWRRMSPLPQAEIERLVERDPLFRKHATWPNWLLRQRELRRDGADAKRLRSRAARLARNMGGSAWLNLRIGLFGLLNTSIAMVLPAVLWQVGWYAGWDNSFNKGYEQYYTGIALSWIGIVLFLGLMLYLPMAQARQAITGEWRSFYDLRMIWRVSTGNPVRTLLLAAAFSLVALPINILLIAPQGIENFAPQTAAMSDSEFLKYLNRYYFRLSILGFLGFVFVRMLAARWYASGLIALLRSGRIAPEDLAGAERHALSVLGLAQVEPRLKPHPVIAATLTVSRPVWRTAVLGAAVLVWFTFVAQIYVREFIVYHPVRGFLNQPLVQVPWVRFVPQALESAVEAARNP